MAQTRTLDIVCYATSAVVGLLTWACPALSSGEREAWDSGVYWSVALPIAYLVCGALAFTNATRTWRWPIVIFAVHALMLAVWSPSPDSDGGVNLLPIGTLFLSGLCVVGVLVARIGAALRQGVPPER